jgi:hypothetical protein
VSHQPERKAKDCLNCGTLVHGRFCHICGQENIVTHQNFTGLTRHFIYDIFHFDGKFLDTFKYLLLKPGFVAKEYVKGRRAKYLDPIRMYLFTSAVFFVLFFSVAEPEMKVSSAPEPYLKKRERMELIKQLKENQKVNPGDSLVLNDLAILMDTLNPLKRSDIISLPPKTTWNIAGSGEYKTVREYDSLQNALSSDKRHSWFRQILIKKGISINTKYSGNVEEGLRKFWESFLHRMPYILFLSLPFFALILKLLYIRRKIFFYSDHAVFTLYHYIFSFFILMAMLGLNALEKWLGWGIFNWLIFFLFVYWLFYLYKSLRNFYGQKRGKTIGKFLLLNLLAFIGILLLFIVFVFFSIFQL